MENNKVLAKKDGGNAVGSGGWIGLFCGGVERCIGAVERLFLSASEWIFFPVEWFYNEYRSASHHSSAYQCYSPMFNMGFWVF